jgi:hypothetical protein
MLIALRRLLSFGAEFEIRNPKPETISKFKWSKRDLF